MGLIPAKDYFLCDVFANVFALEDSDGLDNVCTKVYNSMPEGPAKKIYLSKLINSNSISADRRTTLVSLFRGLDHVTDSYRPLGAVKNYIEQTSVSMGVDFQVHGPAFEEAFQKFLDDHKPFVHLIPVPKKPTTELSISLAKLKIKELPIKIQATCYDNVPEAYDSVNYDKPVDYCKEWFGLPEGYNGFVPPAPGAEISICPIPVLATFVALAEKMLKNFMKEVETLASMGLLNLHVPIFRAAFEATAFKVFMAQEFEVKKLILGSMGIDLDSSHP